MRRDARFACAVTAVALTVGFAGAKLTFAQDASNPEQLKKLYEDALTQLKAAQDRKNELATQNEQLTAKAADLQKQLDAAKSEMQELRRRDAENAEKNFNLRSHHAAWQAFVERYPELKARWTRFLERDILAAGNEMPQLMDADWPMSKTE